MTEVDTVAVLGAGDMGHGIAELAALHGFTVRLRDVDETIVDEAVDKIGWSLDKLADKGRIDAATAEQALDRVTHEVQVSSPHVEIRTEVASQPSPGNPATSHVAVLSARARLRRIVERLEVGT